MPPAIKPVGVSITFKDIPYSVLIYIYNSNGYIRKHTIAVYNFKDGLFATSNSFLRMNYDSATSTMTLYRQLDGPSDNAFPSAIVIPIYDIPASGGVIL